MGHFVETYRGVVFPWHCDQLGHMNVRHYVAMFDDASFHLLTAGGMNMSGMNETGKSFADVPDPQKPPSPIAPTMPMLHPSTVLSFLAAGTSSLKLGTGIILVLFP